MGREWCLRQAFMPRVTLTFDLLTLRVDRFMHLPRGPLMPICIEDFQSVVFATGDGTNGQTDGRTNRQTENIMPPSRGSVCLHGWGITSHDWVFIFLNFSLWPHVFPSECANFPMWIHDQLYVRCLAEYPTDTFLLCETTIQSFAAEIRRFSSSDASQEVLYKTGYTHIIQLYVCLTIAIVLAVYLQNFNMFLRNMLL